MKARPIAAQAEAPIVKFRGDGLPASVDGLRFVVPVPTVKEALDYRGALPDS